MKIYSTAEKAIELAIYHFEINGISVDTGSICHRIYGWYNNTDVTDSEMLAACAIEGIDWSPNATYQLMIEAKDRWFPQEPFYNIPIWDIETAQYDMFL